MEKIIDDDDIQDIIQKWCEQGFLVGSEDLAFRVILAEPKIIRMLRKQSMYYCDGEYDYCGIRFKIRHDPQIIGIKLQEL